MKSFHMEDAKEKDEEILYGSECSHERRPHASGGAE